MKGYKVFNSDWTCRGFQYEVGKTYKHEGKIGFCVSGFHFCKNLSDCFRYYSFRPTNKVAEVEAIGEVIVGDHGCVTDKIVIVKELSWQEVLDLMYTGLKNRVTHAYDFYLKKQSLKKWEAELGIRHSELGLPWDEPVSEKK